MKAKDLIKLLERYPDFEVKVVFQEPAEYLDSHYPLPFNYVDVSVVGLADIGHSSKVIKLDGEKL